MARLLIAVVAAALLAHSAHAGAVPSGGARPTFVKPNLTDYAVGARQVLQDTMLMTAMNQALATPQACLGKPYFSCNKTTACREGLCDGPNMICVPDFCKAGCPPKCVKVEVPQLLNATVPKNVADWKKLCPPGHFTGADGKCTKCAKGSYSKAFNAGSCQPCGINWMAPLSGMWTCIKCPIGFSAAKVGATKCDFTLKGFA